MTTRMTLRNLRFTVGALLLLPASSALADDTWIRQCLTEQGGSAVGDAECYSQYQQRLKDEQTEILGRLRVLLASPAPQGADYRAASRALKQAQKQWLAYVKTDCDAGDAAFGEGNARGLASAACRNDHYATRNALLKEFEKGIDPKTRLDE